MCEDARAFLERYRRASESVRQKEEELDRVFEEVDSLQVSLDGMPHGTELSDVTAKRAVKLADLGVDLQREKAAADLVRREVLEVIDQVPDPNSSRILYDRYIRTMSWSKIIDRENYSDRQIYRYHRDGLMAVGEILKDVSECQ